MGTKITIGNRSTAIPNVYGQIKSGIINPPTSIDYGNVVIIDDGSFASTNYIAASGVNGANKQGLDSFIEFTEYAQTTSIIWDSELLVLMKSLFKPSRRQGAFGANKVTYIQASTTTPATVTFPFAKGSLVLKTVPEGTSMNGSFITKTYNTTTSAALSSELDRGFGIKLETGRAYGYSLGFYRGNHTKMQDPLNTGFGFNEQAMPDIYAGVTAGTFNIVKPTLLFRSPDFRTLSELKKWLDRSPDFKKWFSVTSFTFIPGDETVIPADISANQTALLPYKLFEGATTVFNAEDFTNALALTAGLDNTFYLALKSGDNATGIENSAISNLLTSGDLKFEKYMFVPGYTDSSNFLGALDTTESVASYYNNQHIIVTHGLSKVSNTNYPTGYRNISVLEKTAKLLARTAGLPPETPITFKDIAIDYEVHKLSESEKEAGIEAGILCTVYDQELSAFIVLAGVNTLGNNDYLVNEADASSYDIGVERIKAQLNKELVYNAKRTFFGGEEGPNRSTITQEDLKTWTYGFLKSKIGSLIVRAGGISVTVDQDNYFVNYEFVPNFPVNKVVFTGIILSQ